MVAHLMGWLVSKCFNQHSSSSLDSSSLCLPYPWLGPFPRQPEQEPSSRCPEEPRLLLLTEPFLQRQTQLHASSSGVSQPDLTSYLPTSSNSQLRKAGCLVKPLTLFTREEEARRAHYNLQAFLPVCGSTTQDWKGPAKVPLASKQALSSLG